MISSTLTIRPATGAELEAVARLWTRLLQERATYHPSHGPADRSVEVLADELTGWVAEKEAIVHVAVDPSGTVIGTCVGRLVPRPTGHAEAEVGVVDLVYVSPEQRNAGIGRTMLRAVVEELRHTGAHRLEATLAAENSDAIRFFERARFELHTVTLSRDLA